MQDREKIRRLICRRITVGLLIAAVCGCRPSAPAPRITLSLRDFLGDLTNTTAFAAMPRGEASLVTTYDRSGGNQDWGDFRTPDADGLFSLVNLKGPGCVRRLWMTNIREARWFFFFDGEKQARLVLTNKELFGGKPPFEPPLCEVLSGGSYCYFQFPYAKSLRIAVRLEGPPQNDPRPYYHVNYETYGADTRVVSLPAALEESDLRQIADVRAAWKKGCSPVILAAAADNAAWEKETIAPGASVAWLEQTGRSGIKWFGLRLRLPDGTTPLARDRMLRALVLRMTWDGASAPSVEVPLGDFFCNALHYRRFAVWPMARIGDTYWCAMPMFYRSTAKFELVNDGALPVELDHRHGIYTPEELAAIPEKDQNYFHASWNSSIRAGSPHRIAYMEGRGHFVGCYLTAIGTDGGWNILEGDEMIYLDGERQPSQHGTGLEDYFNGGWYYYGLFDRPLHGLVEKAPIRTMQSRWHLPDRIGFSNGFLMNIEFGDGNRAGGYMSSVAYWYQPAPRPADMRLPPLAGRYPPDDPLEQYAVMAGLFELERMNKLDEARDLSSAYAEKFAQYPQAPMLSLRAEAYREFIEGYAAVSNVFSEVQQRFPGSPLAVQAERLAWFHRAPENALLAVHINGPHTVWLDGREVAKGDNEFELNVVPLTIAPGEHAITVACTPVRPEPWVSLCLRTHTTNLYTDATWECARQKPPQWPSDSGGEWAPVIYGEGMFPSMRHWHMPPNAYVKMQGERQLILTPMEGWESRPGVITAYLRKRFTIPR